jgi:hypothetical protein
MLISQLAQAQSLSLAFQVSSINITKTAFLSTAQPQHINNFVRTSL